MCVLISKVHRAVCMAHIKALRCGMVSSLMRQGICGREVWKMDSFVTDVGWGAGGGLYSSLSFYYHLFSWSFISESPLFSFFAPCSIFWVDPLAVTLYRWLLIELAFNKILTSARNGKPRSKDHIRSIQNLSTIIYRYCGEQKFCYRVYLNN